MTGAPDDIEIAVPPPPKPRKAKAAKAAVMALARKAKGDPAALRLALDAVTALINGPRLSRDTQAARLEAAGVAVGPGFNTYEAKGHGIKASGTAGERGALANWCNAARRKLAQEG